jgi:hypothetical protein
MVSPRTIRNGEHGNSRGEAVREPDRGIIRRASGFEGDRPWRLDVIKTRLVDEDQALLETTHVVPPTL